MATLKKCFQGIRKIFFQVSAVRTGEHMYMDTTPLALQQIDSQIIASIHQNDVATSLVKKSVPSNVLVTIQSNIGGCLQKMASIDSQIIASVHQNDVATSLVKKSIPSNVLVTHSEKLPNCLNNLVNHSLSTSIHLDDLRALQFWFQFKMKYSVS